MSTQDADDLRNDELLAGTPRDAQGNPCLGGIRLLKS